MSTLRSTMALALALALACAAAQAAPTRDPFARPQADPVPASAPADAETTAAAPVLRAVIYAPGSSMANISGQILMAGDQFGPYRVLRIDERSVTLARGKEKHVLALDGESSK